MGGMPAQSIPQLPQKKYLAKQVTCLRIILTQITFLLSSSNNSSNNNSNSSNNNNNNSSPHNTNS